MGERQSNNRSLKLYLYCPSVCKIAEIMAWENQRLDLGTIARTFGLETATLKLNGHFISRGIDLVACSVTWRSLLSFFSSKGLSTGTGGSPPVVVDGRLSKPGTKRSHDPAVFENGISCIKSSQGTGAGESSQQDDDLKSPDSKKLKESNNECDNRRQMANCSDLGLKRKHWLDDVSPFKRIRDYGSFSSEMSRGLEEKDNKSACTTKLPCGYLAPNNMKRMREAEFLVTASCKRTR